MKKINIFLFILFCIFKAEAKKFIIPFEVVAASAELIVIGEITTFDNKKYTLNVIETLKGKSYKSISVKMFEEWTCDVRFAKPAKGQKLCLFLKKESTHWEIINGNTGELQIINNKIALLYEVNKRIKKQSKFPEYTISLNEFKKGIIEFCKCYIYIGEYTINEIGYFKQIVTSREIFRFKKSSAFSLWLYEKMADHKILKS